MRLAALNGGVSGVCEGFSAPQRATRHAIPSIMLRMASQPRWSDLYHAYGVATDTPRHLAALVGDDPQARDAALVHLFGAIIHQGTPWSATAPTARAVVAMLDDPRLDSTSRDAAWPTRASLLDFL